MGRGWFSQNGSVLALAAVVVACFVFTAFVLDGGYFAFVVAGEQAEALAGAALACLATRRPWPTKTAGACSLLGLAAGFSLIVVAAYGYYFGYEGAVPWRFAGVFALGFSLFGLARLAYLVAARGKKPARAADRDVSRRAGSDDGPFGEPA